MSALPKLSRPPLDEAYRACLRLAREHYENFPVASRLLPKRIRAGVAAVYAFARLADDIADEGADEASVRLRRLHDWRALLRRCPGDDFLKESEEISDERSRLVFLALGDTIRRCGLPIALFEDLLDAFRQDILTSSYDTFEDLLGYCRRSANPVGRILLALHSRLDERTAPPADALCTALQLANFWQDLSVDLAKPRLYLPRADCARFAVSREELDAGIDTPGIRALLRFEVDRTREYFAAALPLFPLLPFRLRLELRAIWTGGMRILEKIHRDEYTVLSHRPALSVFDGVLMLLGAVRDPRTPHIPDAQERRR